MITAKHKQMDDLYDEKREVKALIDESDELNHSIEQLYQHLGDRYHSSNMASRMEQFRDEFHFAKRPFNGSVIRAATANSTWHS
ncbi:hypothetical protein W108_00655 [Staphylococcus aureus DAR3504]|nr:hypothetical protein W108_00655 [Staphylococcus aureus DAR3504]EYM65416.1 hypothetical protein W115_02045 [Staphylococcus aureus DAR3519]EYM78737.1 hypothetical protein W120_02543 [Staphylococcus aureus DAR3551]EYN33000.1 hypothetical protein W141_01803 [Staphylococcus aureus DAR3612]